MSLDRRRCQITYLAHIKFSQIELMLHQLLSGVISPFFKRTTIIQSNVFQSTNRNSWRFLSLILSQSFCNPDLSLYEKNLFTKVSFFFRLIFCDKLPEAISQFFLKNLLFCYHARNTFSLIFRFRLTVISNEYKYILDTLDIILNTHLEKIARLYVRVCLCMCEWIHKFDSRVAKFPILSEWNKLFTFLEFDEQIPILYRLEIFRLYNYFKSHCVCVYCECMQARE